MSNYKHGGVGTRLYRIHGNMMMRCNSPKATGYSRYGGRGIKLCDEWKDFSRFRDWSLANGYSDELSIDRIDNDKGYSPDNCRWATRYEQQMNTSSNNDKPSGIKGVYFDKTNGKWRSRISVNGKRKSLGYFDTVEEAIEAQLKSA